MSKKTQTLLIIMIMILFNPVVNGYISALGMQQRTTPEIDNNGNLKNDYPGWNLDRKFAFYFDPTIPEQTTLAYQVYKSAEMVYHNIHMIPITTWDELANAISTDEYWIKGYFLQGGLDGIKLDNTKNWSNLVELLGNGTTSHHIFGSGSTDLLNKSISQLSYQPTNIHIEGSDTLDMELAYFYYLWEIGEILADDWDKEYQNVGEDFKVLGIQYFSSNLNSLLNKQFQPEIVMGEEDVERKKQQFDKSIAAMGKIKQVLPNGEFRELGSTKPAPKTGLVFINDYESSSDTLDLDCKVGTGTVGTDGCADKPPAPPKKPSSSSSFTISDIPLFSGIDGPASEVIDALLDLLIRFGGSKLGLDGDTALELINMIKQLTFLLVDSIEGQGDVDQTLKSLLLKIGGIAPIPEKLKEFFPLFVDAFFLIRGNAEDVVSFSQTVIRTIFGQIGSLVNSSTINNMLGVMESVLMNGPELVLRIQEAKNKAVEKAASFELMSVITNYVFEKLLNFSTYEWLSSLFGSTNSTVLKETSAIMNFTIPLVKAFVLREYGDLFDAIPDVIEYLMGKIKPKGPIIQLGSKTKSSINFFMRLFYLGINLFDQYSDLGGNLFNILTNGKKSKSDFIKEQIIGLLISAKDFILDKPDSSSIFSNTNIKNLVNALFDIFNKAATDGLDTAAKLRSLIVTAAGKFKLPTNTPESTLIIDALVLMGSLIIPSIPNPFGGDYRRLGLSILNLAIKDTDLSEVVTNVFSIVDVVFGLLGILEVGGPAQAIFLEGLEDLDIDGKITRDAKNRILDTVKNQTVNLITAFVGKYVSNNTLEYIPLFADMFLTIFSSITGANGKSIMSMLQAILMQAVQLYAKTNLKIGSDVVIKIMLSLFEGLFSGKSIGQVIGDTISEGQAKSLTRTALIALGVTSENTLNMAQAGIGLLFNLDSLFTNTLDFIFTQLKAILEQFLISFLGKLTNKVNKLFNNLDLLKFAGKIGFKGADFIGLELSFELALVPNLVWDMPAFISWVLDIIFKGATDLDIPDAGAFFKKILSFGSIAPIFKASLGVCSTSSGKGGLFSMLLAGLGADLSFSGKIHFAVQLFSFTSGGFDPQGFMRLLEWGLAITIVISRDFTLFDIVTGGAGGGALNKAAKYIGLQTLTITIYLGLGFEIIERAARNGKEATQTLTLSVVIGASIYIGISLAIVELALRGGVEITLKMIQDLAPNAKQPFKMTLDILFYIEVILSFLFWDWSKRFSFRPPGSPYDITPKGLENLKAVALGFDSDHDGLSDSYELMIPSISPFDADSDDDGLSDKFELLVSKTDAGIWDTDSDGLSDFAEWKIHKTNPLKIDTDLDGLSDYEEAVIYGTNPLASDTDGDLLTDYWEINTKIDISQVTPSVTSIMIGGKRYSDRTDPLNPDTDGDGLIDGQEGEFGPYWGDEIYYDGIDPILIFNDGYTHPLDNDTDDDSYAQLWDGKISGAGASRIYLRDMTDGVEIAGITATVVEIDPDGFKEYVSKVFFTNPTNPDSDGDTATGDPRVGTPGYFLISDGYELTLDPATDPLDGDSDDDGLIDGLEGTARPERNVTTSPYDPDTDGDGLPDGLELTLGSDPGNPDTDADLVLDGDEFFLYGTNPFLQDTDFDGVDDGWELFFSHSNPHSKDSDGDGLSDYAEIFTYGTDPVDEDSDNDNLTDRDEVLEYGTDPTNSDSDEDGLRDGEEIFVFETDPNNADSDADSILYPDEKGNPTFIWNDGQEIAYGTNPRSQDTDQDGLLDSWEIYISTVAIPGFENIPIDPLNNDTDSDDILDGQELNINETQSLIYPYVAVQTYFPYFSSPADADTDDDRLSDRFEIDNNLRADLNDTDGDGLSDWDELFIHLTDPSKIDTDGDGLNDGEEITSALNSTSGLTLQSIYAPKYRTSATEPDSDKDGWPDGLEINATDNDYRYNPYNGDVNSNGVLDGYERDFDNDKISDGDEYYRYNSESTTHGGFLDYRNPDSDFDGLPDGEEVLIWGTLPYSWDTDLDGYSDSFELWIGTDPLVFTSAQEMLDTMRRLNSPIQIRSPEQGRTYGDGKIKVEVFPTVNLEKAYFKYRQISSNTSLFVDNGWSKNFTLNKDTKIPFRPQTWSFDDITFEKGFTYELEVYGLVKKYNYPTSPDRELTDIWLMNKVSFTVNGSYFLGISPENWKLMGGITALLIFGSLGIMIKKGKIKPKRISTRIFKRGGKN